MDSFTGGCLCGSVRFSASGVPYRVGLCHCLDCRKHHGALFHASAVFPSSAVTIDGETRDYAGRFVCPRCRGVRSRDDTTAIVSGPGASKRDRSGSVNDSAPCPATNPRAARACWESP